MVDATSDGKMSITQLVIDGDNISTGDINAGSNPALRTPVKETDHAETVVTWVSYRINKLLTAGKDRQIFNPYNTHICKNHLPNNSCRIIADATHKNI